MEEKKKLYQLFVAVFMIFLLTGGIVIGLLVSKNDSNLEEEPKVEEVSNKNVEVYNNHVYEEDKEEDIEIVYVDIYEDCNHVSENRSNEYGVNIEDIKKRELDKIEKEKSDYKLVKDSDGILMFEKKHNSKCGNHYMLKLEDENVVIYRYTESGEYEKYQDTEILKESLRPDFLYRLEEGIEAETVEELYMFLEELES